MDTTTDYLAIDDAGKVTGIPPRTLRHWIRAGKLPAIAGKRGKLVSVDEVRRVAIMAGRDVGNADHPAGIAGDLAGNLAGNHAEDAATPALVSDAARAQLALLRDEWLAPLVDKIGDLEREVGRLQAERDALRAQLAGQSATAPAPQAPPASAEQPAEPPRRRRWWMLWTLGRT